MIKAKKNPIPRRKFMELLKETTSIFQDIIDSGDEESLRRLEETTAIFQDIIDSGDEESLRRLEDNPYVR